jgi:hypothetical protein
MPEASVTWLRFLGPDGYDEARRHGAAMTYDEIVNFALTHTARIAETA